MPPLMPEPQASALRAVHHAPSVVIYQRPPHRSLKPPKPSCLMPLLLMSRSIENEGKNIDEDWLVLNSIYFLQSVLAPRGLTGSQPNILFTFSNLLCTSSVEPPCNVWWCLRCLHDVIAAAVMNELFVLGSNTNRASRVICSLDPPAVQISLYIFTYLSEIVYLCTYW